MKPLKRTISPLLPEFLKGNDTITIISPAGNIDAKVITYTQNKLLEQGFKVTIAKHCLNKFHRFAGKPEQRFEDLQETLNSPHTKAILCTRGGYGSTHLIEKLDLTSFNKYPKWFVGFSDITIFHNIISKQNIASLHADMPINYFQNPGSLQQVANILKGKLPSYFCEQVHPLSVHGQCSGILTGGNLSVFTALRASPFDIEFSNRILFLEDVGESLHHVERMLYGLKISGALSQLAGLIVGRFSDISDDPSMGKTLEQLIVDLVQEYNYPVLFDFPAGHIQGNQPLVMGAQTQLSITPDNYQIACLT